MISFEFDRDEQVEGTCDMIISEYDPEEHPTFRHVDEERCENDAVIEFIEDGEPRRFCLEHGKMRVRNLANSSVVWDVYASE